MLLELGGVGTQAGTPATGVEGSAALTVSCGTTGTLSGSTAYVAVALVQVGVSQTTVGFDNSFPTSYTYTIFGKQVVVGLKQVAVSTAITTALSWPGGTTTRAEGCIAVFKLV